MTSRVEPSVPNSLLRAHVTRVGFDLQLPRTGIARLVTLVRMLATDEPMNAQTWRQEYPIDPEKRRLFNDFCRGSDVLLRRGLITYNSAPEDGLRRDRRPSATWGITNAGWLVIGLLKEAGLWAEYEAAAPISYLSAEEQKHWARIWAP